MPLYTASGLRLPDWAPAVPDEVAAADAAIDTANAELEKAGRAARDAREHADESNAAQDINRAAQAAYRRARTGRDQAERHLRTTAREHAAGWAPAVDAALEDAISEAEQLAASLVARLHDVRNLRGLLNALEVGDLERMHSTPETLDPRAGGKVKGGTVSVDDPLGLVDVVVESVRSARTRVRAEQRARRASSHRVVRERLEKLSQAGGYSDILSLIGASYGATAERAQW